MLHDLDAALLWQVAGAARGAGLSRPAIWITALGAPAIRNAIVMLVLFWLAWLRAWRPALFLTATVAGGALIVALLKLAIARDRPDLMPQLDHVSNASMPSGHAANGACAWLGSALAIGSVRSGARRWLVIGALFVVLLIGLSRLVLAVHWPSDVAVGWGIGIGWTLLCARLFTLHGPALR